MCATFFYLITYPETYVQLSNEIRSTFSSLDDIGSGTGLQSCGYLTACVHESMRMSPPTPRAPWREVDRGGAVVGGDFIPEGCDVGT